MIKKQTAVKNVDDAKLKDFFYEAEVFEIKIGFVFAPSPRFYYPLPLQFFSFTCCGNKVILTKASNASFPPELFKVKFKAEMNFFSHHTFVRKKSRSLVLEWLVLSSAFDLFDLFERVPADFFVLV